MGMNKRTRYQQLKNGEAIEIKPGEILKLACCDCGLVHNIGIAVEDNGNIGLAFERNVRATGQMRRFNKYPR